MRAANFWIGLGGAIMLGIGGWLCGLGIGLTDNSHARPTQTITITTSPPAKTAKPSPKKKVKKPTRPPSSRPAKSTLYYGNCTDMREDYSNGVPRGHQAYRSSLDRDNDGRACEQQ